MKKDRSIIRKGSQHLDDIIAAAISTSGYYSNRRATYHGTYLDLLESDGRTAGRWGNKLLFFVKGYCAMKEISAYAQVDVDKELVYLAVRHFEEFLLHQEINSEIGFVAAWKAAILKYQLDLCWSAAEEKLLVATDAHPERGEAIREIMDHYVAESNYKIAYIYSSYCMDRFLGNAPKRDKKWIVDFPFYNWRVLEYHITSCFALKKRQEAHNAYKALKDVIKKSVDYFSQDDLKRIILYDKWFGRDQQLSESEGYDKILYQ